MPVNKSKPLHGRLLYEAEQVNLRIAEMAKEILEHSKPDNLLFVSLHGGAQPFTAKLMFAIYQADSYFQPNVQSMMVSRYGRNREPGLPKLVVDLPPAYRDLSSYRVILLDDLIEGGETLQYARQHLLNYGAQNVDCIVLVKKQTGKPVACDVRLYGFEAPDGWLTGMGMDDARLAPEANRWAEWIAIAVE